MDSYLHRKRLMSPHVRKDPAKADRRARALEDPTKLQSPKLLDRLFASNKRANNIHSHEESLKKQPELAVRENPSGITNNDFSSRALPVSTRASTNLPNSVASPLPLTTQARPPSVSASEAANIISSGTVATPITAVPNVSLPLSTSSTTPLASSSTSSAPSTSLSLAPTPTPLAPNSAYTAESTLQPSTWSSQAFASGLVSNFTSAISSASIHSTSEAATAPALPIIPSSVSLANTPASTGSALSLSAFSSLTTPSSISPPANLNLAALVVSAASLEATGGLPGPLDHDSTTPPKSSVQTLPTLPPAPQTYAYGGSPAASAAQAVSIYGAGSLIPASARTGTPFAMPIVSAAATGRPVTTAHTIGQSAPLSTATSSMIAFSTTAATDASRTESPQTNESASTEAATSTASSAFAGVFGSPMSGGSISVTSGFMTGSFMTGSSVNFGSLSTTGALESPNPTASELMPSSTEASWGTLGDNGSMPTNSPGFGAAGSQDNNNGNDGGKSNHVDTPTVVGGVVGGIAALTFVLLALLLLLRRYKQRQKAIEAQRELASGDAAAATGVPVASQQPTLPNVSGAAASSVFAAIGGAASRFSFKSPRPAPPPPPETSQTRGFERVSGRKLASQFSPGMEGPSGNIQYQSGVGAAAAVGAAGAVGAVSAAYPSGTTASSDATSEEDPFADPPEEATGPVGGLASVGPRAESRSPAPYLKPGPGRTPEMHQASDPRVSQLAAPSTPTLASPQRSAVGIARPSQDGSSVRNSRFQEDFV